MIGFDREGMGSGGSLGGGAAQAGSGALPTPRASSGGASATEEEFRRIMRSGSLGEIFGGVYRMVTR
ncbi:hypothetical protein GXW74_19835 [Roseomonas eburnea]|uniref:Uncharacterized protein n=1 Tax=Neoroseomonas eburnea TaxID=1346889 RepID=A0A9X9XGB7_9PROT|nr:hypothetical protein [Neoroseomonas eburnea]MBR0682753.1 hypothetical protein [Neoroseomonas eburnea]